MRLMFNDFGGEYAHKESLEGKIRNFLFFFKGSFLENGNVYCEPQK